MCRVYGCLMARSLKQYEMYSREEVHEIFSPDTPFTPQSGSWGLHGVIRLPHRQNDFVFFCTLGKQQGDYKFDESISSEGVLSWQSQPSQTLDEDRVISWINHNELQDNIYLFLRNKPRIPYTYYGKLAYISHDQEREKPVHFQWQILNWDADKIPEDFELLEADILEAPKNNKKENLLIESSKPTQSKSHGVSTQDFRARKCVDYTAVDEKNKKLGLAGELLVLDAEKKRLQALGLSSLADKVVHVAVTEGDGAGYDIRSFNKDGSERYIEVKTTRGGKATGFYLSANEAKFAEIHSDTFYLYRVFNYDWTSNSADFFILEGDILSQFDATPTTYKIRF